MALVYSTETGRLCDGCEQPIDQCCCKPASAPEGDGTVRVQREKKGRGGKTVTILSGIEGDKKVLSDLCKKLKKRLRGSFNDPLARLRLKNNILLSFTHVRKALNRLVRFSFTPNLLVVYCN